MGTAHEWLEVLMAGIFWLGTMLIFYVLKGSVSEIRSSISVRHVLIWSSAALWFGIVDTFRWNAFHLPLIFLTGATLAIAAFAGRRRTE